jgi:hypothetical protein
MSNNTDFLEQDDAIRGQNYACLSFISPENVLKNKNLYKMSSFLRHLVKNNNINLSEEFLNNIDEKYKDYLYSRDENLEKEFYKENDFKTTVRGLKVRGVYDTLQEAQSRAKLLQRRDKYFNVFVGQVGFWLPWDPESHKVDNQEYFESELNELVTKYRENKDKKDEHFRENIEYVKEQAAREAARKKEQNSEANSVSLSTEQETPAPVNDVEVVNSVDEELKQTLESGDPWLESKKRNESSQ